MESLGRKICALAFVSLSVFVGCTPQSIRPIVFERESNKPENSQLAPKPSLEGNADIVGGGDRLEARLAAARFNLVVAMRAIKSNPDSPKLCHATDCRARKGKYCALLIALTLAQREYCKKFVLAMVDEFLKLHWSGNGNSVTAIEISKKPLHITHEGNKIPVKAYTQLLQEGAITYGPDADDMEDDELFAVLAHESGHKTKFLGKFIQDFVAVGPFKLGKTLLNIAAAAILEFSPEYHSPKSGSYDFSLKGKGAVVTGTDEGDEYANYAMATQPDGKVLHAGSSWGTSQKLITIFRYQPDGKLDPSFGDKGAVRFSLNNSPSVSTSLATRENGKIVLVAWVEAANGNPHTAIVQLLPDGSFDPSFGVDGKLFLTVNSVGYDIPRSVAVQADGKIVVCGYHSSQTYNNGVYRDAPFLLRVHEDGRLDTNFANAGMRKLNPESLSGDHAWKVVLDGAQRIVMAGSVVSGSRRRLTLWRFHPDGSFDTTFGAGGRLVNWANYNSQAFDLIIQPDGKLLAVGTKNDDVGLFRYLDNGSTDSLFGLYGVVSTHVLYRDVAFSAKLDSKGRLLVAGRTEQTRNRGIMFVLRFLSDGSLDTSFANSGKFIKEQGPGKDDVALALNINSKDGTVLVGGYTRSLTDYDFALFRIWQ